MTTNIKKGFAAILMAATLLFASQGSSLVSITVTATMVGAMVITAPTSMIATKIANITAGKKPSAMHRPARDQLSPAGSFLGVC